MGRSAAPCSGRTSSGHLPHTAAILATKIDAPAFARGVQQRRRQILGLESGVLRKRDAVASCRDAHMQKKQLFMSRNKLEAWRSTYDRVHAPDVISRPSDRAFPTRVYTLQDVAMWSSDDMRRWYDKNADPKPPSTAAIRAQGFDPFLSSYLLPMSSSAGVAKPGRAPFTAASGSGRRRPQQSASGHLQSESGSGQSPSRSGQLTSGSSKPRSRQGRASTAALQSSSSHASFFPQKEAQAGVAVAEAAAAGGTRRASTPGCHWLDFSGSIRAAQEKGETFASTFAPPTPKEWGHNKVRGMAPAPWSDRLNDDEGLVGSPRRSPPTPLVQRERYLMQGGGLEGYTRDRQETVRRRLAFQQGTLEME